jgi:hypothetical protein
MMQNPGRLAGLLYAVASIPGFFALLYVPGKLIVHGDATATAQHIAASEMLFRLGIGAGLVGQALFIFVAVALYHLLKGINQRRAMLMLILILSSIPIAFLNEVNSMAALALVRGEGLLAAFEKPQRDALAMLFLNLRSYGFDVIEIFWGLWLFPLGLLVYRSGFIPRIFGVLLMANCVTFPVNGFTSMLLPQYERLVSRWMMPLGFGELAFMFWLLIMGAEPPATTESTHAG